MLAACRLSQWLGLLDEAVGKRVERLLETFGLPTRLEGPIETDRILKTIQSDKKVQRREPRFILLEGIGQPVVRDDVPEQMVRRAYESLLS